MDEDVVRIPSQLSVYLRAARLARKLTQSEVASQLGISVQAMSRLENNAERASFDRIHRLALVLGLETVLRPRSQVVVDSEW